MQLWTDLLNFIDKLVSPDWGGLIALLPLGIALLVVLYVVWVVLRFATAPPTRRGPGRRPPQAPSGIHMPGPSWAPIFAAVGLLFLFYGLVFHGWFLVIGPALLGLSLLYWLRESMRDYDHVAHEEPLQLAPANGGPPPGIHMPGPSFRPILASISLAALLYGLVFGPWIFVAGVLMLVTSLVEWLVDARHEYVAVAEADITGHLASQPRPGYPRKTLSVFVVLFAAGIVFQSGVLPPKPSAGAAAGGTGTTGAGAGAAPTASAVAADVTLTAQNISFTQTTASAPAGRPFTIDFQNMDPSIPHDVTIHKDTPAGALVFSGDIITGPASKIYDVPALTAGTYAYVCSVHPTTMIGTLTVK